MGSSQSTLSDKPWRDVTWGGKQDLLDLVKGFKPSTDEVNHVRILLYGPVGAGKSSFVNSVSTVVRERSAIPAAVSTISGASFTVEYKTHKIRKGAPKEYYPFVFNDIMGLESGDDVGVRAEDIRLAMMGHVRDGYKFNPVSTLSESNTQFYNSSPSANDKVHLLVCVLSANSPEIKPSVIQKMKEIREAARDLGIPQVAIATHIDLIAKEVEKDVKNVFRSEYLKQKMSEFSSTVGIPMNCIFPLKNYCNGVENEDDMDTLILTALKHMLNYADDFVDTL
uniref:G domain-containing protein n=1 Tax=Neogobius melanostomus TaxID=47308 RepID=A0A8C6WJB0_9GOBI